MSVASTISITNERNSRNSSLDRFCKMLHSSSRSILNKSCAFENYSRHHRMISWKLHGIISLGIFLHIFARRNIPHLLHYELYRSSDVLYVQGCPCENLSLKYLESNIFFCKSDKYESFMVPRRKYSCAISFQFVCRSRGSLKFNLFSKQKPVSFFHRYFSHAGKEEVLVFKIFLSEEAQSNGRRDISIL